MATWHQQRRGLQGLYAPHETEWKVAVDKPHQLAYGMGFTTAEKAEEFASRSGGVVIPPKSATTAGAAQ